MKATKSKKKINLKSRRILKCPNCKHDGRTSFRKRFGGCIAYVCKNCNRDVLLVDSMTGKKLPMATPVAAKGYSTLLGGYGTIEWTTITKVEPRGTKKNIKKNTKKPAAKRITANKPVYLDTDQEIEDMLGELPHPLSDEED